MEPEGLATIVNNRVVDPTTLDKSSRKEQPTDPTLIVDYTSGHQLGCPSTVHKTPKADHSVMSDRGKQPSDREIEHIVHTPSPKWHTPDEFTQVTSAKIWFFWICECTTKCECGMRMLSYERKGAKPSYDTFGGTKETADSCIKDCLARELKEEVASMPEEWHQQIEKVTTMYPKGHNTYYSVKWDSQESHYTTVWFVRIHSSADIPVVSTRFVREECVPDSLGWRSATDILINLNQYVFQQPLVLIIQGAQRQQYQEQKQRGRPTIQESELRAFFQEDQQAIPRKGIIEVCAGLGMMADSCVECGFASVIATCERNGLCHNLLRQKHPGADHYRDLMKVKDEVWAQYKWDPERPSQTAYILVGGPPCTPYSKSGRREDLNDPRSREMQHMVHVTQILQSPLVIIENVVQFLQSDSWRLLRASFRSIGYALVHEEGLKHSNLGGATNRRRVFVWFQRNSTLSPRAFPRIRRPDLFTIPQMVVRDVLNPTGHITNPPPIRNPLVWNRPFTFEVGKPACIGKVMFGDSISSPQVEQGCRGSLMQEEGIWSILSCESTGMATFLNCDKDRTRKQIHPLSEFTRQEGGQWCLVYSIDGIIPTIRASGEYPQRTTCLVWQPQAGGGEIRRLSTEEIWRIQQLNQEDLRILLEHTHSWDHQRREDALQKAAGNSICKPMADIVAQLTAGRIRQLEGIIDVNTTTTTNYESGGDDHQLEDTEDEEEDDRDVETDSDSDYEERQDVSDCGVTEVHVDEARKSEDPNGEKEELDSRQDTGSSSRPLTHCHLVDSGSLCRESSRRTPEKIGASNPNTLMTIQGERTGTDLTHQKASSEIDAVVNFTGVDSGQEPERILYEISDVMNISPEEIGELSEYSMNESCEDLRPEEKPPDREFHPIKAGSHRINTRRCDEQGLEESPLGRFNGRDIITEVAEMVQKVPGMVPKGKSVFPLPQMTGYEMHEEKSLIIGCDVRASKEECHKSYWPNGVLKNQSDLRTTIHTAVNVAHRSNIKIKLNPRVCYRKDGTSVDLTQTAAFETLVRLTRQLEQNGSDGPTEVSDLPWVPGMCDEPGDPFYEPVEIPKNVHEAVDEFIESCVTAIKEGDPSRVWKPPTDSSVATYMSIVLTTPLYTWAIGPNGVRIKVLLDSGSAISLIPNTKDIESSSEFILDKSAPSITVRGVDPGSCLKSGGIVSFPLRFPVQEFEDQKQTGSENSRNAYTIQMGPIEGPNKVRMTPIDDSRTHVHFQFRGFHIEKAGCGTLIGMDLLAGESLGGNWATPMSFDFKNGRVLFSAPPLPTQSETRVARVPTFYNTPQKETSNDSPTVLVVVYHEIHIPPGQTVQARCVAQCGFMPKKGVCTIDAFSGLPMVKDGRNGYTDRATVGRQYVMSRYLPDPDLFITEKVLAHEREIVIDKDCPSPHRNGKQRYRHKRNLNQGVDDKLRTIYNGLHKEIRDNKTSECGLLVKFPSGGILAEWSQIDNSTKGKADLDVHLEITNTSPVEMVVLAGQPIAEATAAVYEDPQRNIARIAKQPHINQATAKSLTFVGDTSTCDVAAITFLMNQEPEENHVMKRLFNEYVGDTTSNWPRLTDINKALRETGAAVSAKSVIGRAKVQRGVCTEFLMALIHTTGKDHRISELTEEVDEAIFGKSHDNRWKDVEKKYRKFNPNNPEELGKYRFVLAIHKLLYGSPGLIVSVIADMMQRSDTKEHLKKMFLSCAESPSTSFISQETMQCNFDNLLIMERWVENSKRAIRATPIEDEKELVDFQFPAYDSSGNLIYYTSRKQEQIDKTESGGRVFTIDRLMEALSVITKDSDSRRERMMASAQVNMLQEEARRDTPNQSAGYACLSLQTLVLSEFDDQLGELMTVDDRDIRCKHEILKVYMCTAQEATSQQYGRQSTRKVDHSERERVWSRLCRKGLVEVQPSLNGIDTMKGSPEELDASLDEMEAHQATSNRNIEEENEKDEAIDPALGGDPANIDQGYHYDVKLTQEELKAQLTEQEERLKAQPWYNSRLTRMVPTSDKTKEGEIIEMPWWRWTCIQAWRKLRSLETEETQRGEDEENLMYTLRSVLDVGLPDDEEMEMMNLEKEDRLYMVESIWRMAPCFYQGPNLPQIRHFSFTRMFMSLVTDVPYRQKPLIIPVHAEELVYTSIRAMIKDGVVEASLSPYNNGLLLVAKKPARPGAPPPGMRVVLDARGLNHITRRVNWPIEDLSLCLKEVAGAAFITVTDVLSGFHLIPLDPECRPPTAFTCGSLGHLQYCRAGMGMANSPARFASALSGVLGVLRHNSCGQGHNREGDNYGPYPHSGVCSSKEMLNNTEIGVTEERTREFRENKRQWILDRQASKRMDEQVEDIFTLHRCLCIVYVDDVTVATWYDRSKDKPDHHMEVRQLRAHLKCVEGALMRMRQFGIICKAVKTEIARPCNELLGYIVGRDGLRANPKKIEKLMDVDLPKSKEGLHFFIGLAGFYRQFIPRLAELEAPLRKLLNHPGLPATAKDVNDHTAPTCWNESLGEDETTPMDSFKAIIRELAKFTALSSIDYRPQAGRVGIAADASRYGLAAVLFQETVCGTDKDGRQLYKERPICYWSKALVAKNQSAYPYDRELAAITLAVRNWHKYILGRRILIVSDHQPLDYMLEPKKNSISEKKQSSRLLWLIMELSRYDVIVSWRAGKWIPHADALSRILKVGRIISLTTKPVMVSEPHVENSTSCDRISLICGDLPYTREDQVAAMLEGDNAERAWLADQSDTEAAVQQVATHPELWHAAKEAILTDLKTYDHGFKGSDDEIYMGYITQAKESIEFATECRSKGKKACTHEEWEKYCRIAAAIGLDPDQQSDTLTPFKHIATSGTVRGDAKTEVKGWIQIAQGKEWSLSDQIPCSSENADVMQLLVDADEKGWIQMEEGNEWSNSNQISYNKVLTDVMQLEVDEEDTSTIRIFKCQVTVDKRHMETRNLDPLYQTALKILIEDDSDYEKDEFVPSYMIVQNPRSEESSGVVSTLMAWAQEYEGDPDYEEKGGEAVEEERKDSGCNKVGVDADVENVHELLVAIHGFKVAQQWTTQSSEPIPQKVEEGGHGELAESREEAEMSTVLKGDATEKDVIDQVCQNHINMVMEQEMHDANESTCDNRGDDQAQSTYNVDLEVNVTKVEIDQLRKCWDKENAVCVQHYKETDHPIVIKWHNVNGIGSFVRHLRQEGSDYFKSEELHPDIFIILEAKVSAARKEAVDLIDALKDLIEELTGCEYLVVKSLRKSTSRCGTVAFLKTSFLKTREWWTWSADLEVYDPTYMNLRSAGYICGSQQELTQYNEWDRKPVGDGDGRIIQILLGPDKRLNSTSKHKAALRVIGLYTRNSSSGHGEVTARVNFEAALYQCVNALPGLPTIMVGDVNVCVEEKDVMTPAGYIVDHDKIIGCLPHEKEAYRQFIDSGLTTNNIEDRKQGRVVGHTAGGMGGFSHQHWLQLFNLDRAMYRLIGYVFTAYKSLSALGEELTQRFIDRTRQQSQLTKAMTGSDHTPQLIIFKELDLCDNRLEAAETLHFKRPERSGAIAEPEQISQTFITVMSLVMAREFFDEAAYAMSFPPGSEEAQIVWAGLGYRHKKRQPNALERVTNFRREKMSLVHRWMGITRWFNPFPRSWGKESKRFTEITKVRKEGDYVVSPYELESNHHDYLHSLMHDLYQLHRGGYVEQRCGQEFRKLQSIRTSTQPSARRYVTAVTQGYGISFLSSKEDPNRAPANNAWRMGPMIFQPRDNKTQKRVTNIAIPGLIVIPDHYTNERYTQITEHLTSGKQSGSFGTTRAKDAGPYPYRSESGPVDRGLRRFPGEGGGRSGLQGMAYARHMYQAAEMITEAQNIRLVEENREEESPFQTYSAPMVYIAQMINTMVNQVEKDRPNREIWDDMVTAGALLEALRNCASMYVYRAGTWIEYNTVFGNRLTELKRPNYGIPTTPKLISRVDRCMKEYVRLLGIVEGLILTYLWSLRNEPPGSPREYRYRIWMVHYRWHVVSDRYRRFKPKYKGENSGRCRQQALREKKRIKCDERLQRIRVWDQCKLRMPDSPTPISDLQGDTEGLFRKTIRTIVDNRSQRFTKVMRTPIKEGGDKVVENVREPHTNEPCTKERVKLSSEERRKHYYGKNESKGVEAPKEPSVKKAIRHCRWMITWTRLETAKPFPGLETYIPHIFETEWLEKDLERTPSNRKLYGYRKDNEQILEVPNRINWSAATIRKKTHMKGNDPVVTERVTVYAEFDRPVSQGDMQRLVERRVECMKTTNEWRLNMRVWDGSDPIEQIHTRDPTSEVELIKHIQIIGDQRQGDPRQSEGIGTSGRRPLASDPYALHSNRMCIERWNGFIGKADRQVPKAKKGKPSAPSKRVEKCEETTPESSLEADGKEEKPNAPAQQERKSEESTPEITQGPEIEEENQFCNCAEGGIQCYTCSSWEEMKQESQVNEGPVDECMILMEYGPDGGELHKPHRPESHCYPMDLRVRSSQQSKTLDSCRKRPRKEKSTVPKQALPTYSHELEDIIEERKDSEGNSEFLCTWKGWSEAHNEWITQENLSQAKRLVREWRSKNPTEVEGKCGKKRSCDIYTDPDTLYTNNPQTTDKSLDVTLGLKGGLHDSPGWETQAPTTFLPQPETVVSRRLRESQAAGTDKCPELKILMYLIKHAWKKPPETEQLDYQHVYDKYHRYSNVLKEVNGSIYRIRTEEADSADNEQTDRIKPPSCGRELQWIPPLGKRWGILQQTHATPDVGHPCSKIMLKRVQDVMWWPDITKHVKMLTETCEVCQRAKRRKDPLRGAATTLRYKLPNSELLIDVIEGLCTARNGWKYIIATTCASSRYTELFGSATNDSKAIAEAIIHWIVNGGHGFPRMIRTGRDTGIVSAAIHELLRRLTISNKTLNAWAPQLLGTNERTHTEVGSHIRIYTAADPEGWNLLLPWAQMAHNTSIHRMTGCTPLMLMKGNPCETLLAASYLPEQTSSIPLKDLANDYMRFYYQLTKDARRRDLVIHNENIQKLQEGFDEQKVIEPFAVGTKVLVFVPWVPAQLNQGLADRWHGPFIVMKSNGDSYFLQSTKTNHERNQWIKVSRSRVRRLIRLNEPVNVKSRLSDDKHMEPDLSSWTAIISKGDLSDGELEVTISPTAVTAVLFNLDREYSPDSDYEERGEMEEEELVEPKEELIKRVWTEKCSTLLARYWVHDENEHPMSSRNYSTGDYITLVGCIRDHLEEAERLIETLSSDQVAPIRELVKGELTDLDITNHYVLLPHEGQLKGRTMADVEGSSARFSTIVYCTAAGESLNHLRNWTSLNHLLIKRAARDMNPAEKGPEFTNKARRLPRNTWIEMDTPTIPHSYKLLGSWHRYDKISKQWDPKYGAPKLQATQQHTEDDDYGVESILMCREGRAEDTSPDELHYAVRWEGRHEQQHSVVAGDQFFSDLRDTFVSNQSIRLGGGYFISKGLNKPEDVQYLIQLAVKEEWPSNVMAYIRDQLSMEEAQLESGDNGGKIEPDSECFSCHRFVHECYGVEEKDEWEEYHEICNVDLKEDPGKMWMEFGKKWSRIVHFYSGEKIDVPKEQYFEFMRALYRKEAKEARKATRVTVKGEIKPLPNRPVAKGINIEFVSEKSVTMKGLHADKEIMITLTGAQPEVIRGTIMEKTAKGFFIHIKERDREALSQIITGAGQGGVEGELEPVDRDTFEQQLDVLVANPAEKLTNPGIRDHILSHDGKKVMGKLVSHGEVEESTHSGLNNSQSEIVRWAGQLKGIGLLFGPPGTGKTHTSAEIILEWARTKETSDTGAIFVVATSNVAVDALMMKLITLLTRIGTIMSIGRLSSRTHSDNMRNDPILRKYDILQQVWEERKRMRLEEAETETAQGVEDFEDFLGSGSMDIQTKNWIRQQMIIKASKMQIIFTTVALAGSTLFKEINMTHLLMEESGATPEFSTVPSLAKNPHTVLLIGDFMQLEPVILCHEVKAVLVQSLFQRLWFTDIPKRQLQVEYRLPGSVIAFFNDTVYNADHGLQPIMMGPDYKERPVPVGLLIKNPIVVVDSTALSKKPGEGEETQVPQRGYYNKTEAETIVEMVAQLLQCLPETKAAAIGISAPYKMQIAQIRDLMGVRKSWPPGFKPDQVLIATVDAFQGSERNFMFVSTVRSSYHGLNFAASLKRINVILSRGIIATFVISNSRVFGRSDLRVQGRKHPQDVKEGLEALQRLFKWQNQLENVYNLDTWRRIFSTPNHKVMTMSEESITLRRDKCKTSWEKLYYESWRRNILKQWIPDLAWTPGQIEENWPKFRVIFNIANTRRVLADMMAYCTQLWIDNVIVNMGGANPARRVRSNNTVLTVQNSEVPVKGWPHLSYQRYPLLLLTILLDGKATDKSLYRKRTIMSGIERGQREDTVEKIDKMEEWYKVSERSMRGMLGMTVLTTLAMGIVLDRVKLDTPWMINGQVICIRLELLSKLWGDNDRENWDRTNSYSEVIGLRESVLDVKWRMILHRCNVYLEIKQKAVKVSLSQLVISLMTRLNFNRVRKKFERRKWRQLYLRRRWRNIYFRSSWGSEWNGVNRLHHSTAWKDQVNRYPWYRYIPLVTWLSMWETFGLRYLPTSSREESWMDWPNPELDVNMDIEDNDKVWNQWAKQCGDLMKLKGIEFYEEQDIHNWWSHLHIINKREVARWLLYDRQNYQWHHSTGAWIYYLGKIPGSRQRAPRTILHHRERSLQDGSQDVSTERYGSKGCHIGDTHEPIEGHLIPKRDWDKHLRESRVIGVNCYQRWPKISAKGPGFNSLGNRTWATVSKEDALEEQRTLCERIARHRVGECRDGHLLRADSVYINSPYAREEWNLPMFPDHEAEMAGTGTGQPGNGRYNVRVMDVRSSLREGRRPDTWLGMGITVSLMRVNPPEPFVSGPSQSSEVTYSQPSDNASHQSQMRLLLRDLSRSHDVQQGRPVAKRFENMSKLLSEEVLNQIGLLNHPA